jgi:hypothetical protein
MNKSEMREYQNIEQPITGYNLINTTELLAAHTTPRKPTLGTLGTNQSSTFMEGNT